MKIAFVFPIVDAHSRSKPIRYPFSINLGISYMSSILKVNGHLTRLFVLTRNNRNQIEKSLDEFVPQLICFTAVSTAYYLIKDFARKFKERHPRVFLIAGGCHVSLNPEEAIADSFDAICIGEGEYPTLELADQLEQGISPSKIQNLWIKKGIAIEKNPTRPFIEKLDELPFPDRQIWKEWIRYPEKLSAILLSRGCPYKCTYCCNHKLARLAGGSYHRYRSPQNIIAEIKEHLREYPQTREIFFRSETIGTNLKYILKLCSSLEQFNKEREQPLAFGVNLRVTPNMDHDTLFQTLHRGNFKFINIGLESGSERVRREILNRVYSNDDIIKAVTLLKKYGIKINLFVMVGLPGETPRDFQQTIEVTRKCQPDFYYMSIFYPYPGTELARICKEQGLIDERINMQSVRERVEPVLNLPDFPKKQVLRSYIWFEYNISKGYKPLHKILIRVLLHKVTTSPLLGRFFNFLLNIPFFVDLKNKLVDFSPFYTTQDKMNGIV